MATINPSSEIAGLYDELTRLPYSAHAKIEQIEITLRSILHKSPDDVCARIAFMQALAMSSKIEEAIKEAEIVWKDSVSLHPLVEQSYISSLVDIGLFSWATALVSNKLSERFDRGRLGYFPVALSSAVGGGDIDLLLRTAQHEEAGDNKEKIEFLVGQMKQYELDTHFTKQQSIVNELTLGQQAAYEVVIDKRRNWPFIDIGIFIKGDSVDRYRLQAEIDKAVRDYYAGLGIQTPKNSRTRIFDLDAHLPPDGTPPE